MAKIGFAVGMVLLLSLASSLSLPVPASASQDVVKWSRVNIPTEGKAGDWVLASGSDIKHPALAIDGTLYAYGEGLTYTLYKSTDGGSSWSYCDRVSDTIVGIAPSPVDSDVVYYSTSSGVYKSTDAGNNFIMLAANPGGAGSNNIEITSIALAHQDNRHIIAVGTRDSDPSQYGGVYILDEGTPFSGWKDTSVGNYDVYAVAFSPNFASDRQLLAVVTDETDTVVTFMDSFGWVNTTGDAKLNKDNSAIPAAVAVQNRAAIAFPSDYDPSTNGILFVAIDAGAGSGDVYMINGVEPPGNSVAIDLNIGSGYGLNNVDATSLAVTGNALSAKILAGAAQSSQVYRSSDRGSSWTRSQKPPTGQSETYILMAPDFTASGLAYAATTGNGSAFSYTTDGGSSWNQPGLIDTDISNIVDLTFSPNYSQDDTLFMLTQGSEESLWRSQDEGKNWERILTRTLAGADSLTLVEHSPQPGSQVLFLAGGSAGQAAIWRSSDNGQTFALPQPTSDPISGTDFHVDTWVITNDDILFIGSFDGLNALVYRSSNSGLTYSIGAMAGNQPPKSMALSPGYEQDKTVMLGNANGWVYWSSDNGTSFEPLPPDATSPPLTGSVTAAFDPKFNRNRTVYASSSNPDEGIFRFVIGSSTSWASIDSTLPGSSILSGFEVSTEGVLYASNLKAEKGIERSLNPTYSLGPTFETVTRGLESGATLSGLWLVANQLWSIDSTNIKLMTFVDSLTRPVILSSPADESSGVGTVTNDTINDANLDWETLEGATSYRWQLDSDTDFSSVPAGFEGTTRASQAKLPALMPATTYYWRTRVTEPILSPWSAKWAFTTSLGTEVITLELLYPEAGAGEMPVKPLFQWSAIAGAEAYELMVSADPRFSNPVILKTGDYALSDTAWQSNINLNYDTTYYWKIRALGSGTNSTWSAAGAFTTTSPPVPSSSPTLVPSPPPPPLTPPAQETTPEWVKYLIGALLLVIILLVVILLTVILVIRRG